MSRSNSPFDPDDIWASDSEEMQSDINYSQFTNPIVKNPYEGTPASKESITEAFSRSNAMQVLREDSQTNFSNNKFVSLQNQQEKERPISQNILPHTVRQESMGLDTFFGNLGVETQVESGEWTDRLGNTYKIMQSEMPPADKDYTNYSDYSSDRKLEKMGVFVAEEKRKSEVEGTINPAEELVSSKQSFVRNNELEMNNREMFFNKNGLQPIPEFDQNRDMYDGFNWKSGHETRTYPLENSWRDELSQPVSIRKASQAPEKRTSTGLHSKRKEITSTFHVKNANATTPLEISAKQTRITLPVLSEASLRCDYMPIAKSPHIEHNENIGRVAKHESTAIERGRLENSLDVKKSQENIVVSSMKANMDHLNELRQNGAVTPVASREWDTIQKIAQGIDHLNSDDTELHEILNHDVIIESSHIESSTDHLISEELPTQDPRTLDMHTETGSNIKSHVDLNENREMHMKEKPVDHILNVSAQKAKITLNESDSITVNRKENSNNYIPNKILHSKQEIQDNNRQIKQEKLSQPLIVDSEPVFPSVTINENDRQQNAKIYSTNDVIDLNHVKSEIILEENDRQQELKQPATDIIEANTNVQSKITLEENNRQQHSKNPQSDTSSMLFEPVEMNVNLPTKNRQQLGQESQGSSPILNKQVDSTVHMKDERKMMSGRMINTVTADNYMNTAKHTLPILERAQYVVQRPGYMNTTTKIQTETNLPDNNRNNISNRTMIMEGDMPSVHGTIQTTASEENSAFARTNSSDSTSYAMKINIEAPETNSGFASIDRINPAYKQNWRRNEMKVEQKFQENEDRSTPCRSPSRNMNTDVRMTSTLQSESKREMCERPVSSQSHRSTPLMRAAISRNEDTY